MDNSDISDISTHQRLGKLALTSLVTIDEHRIYDIKYWALGYKMPPKWKALGLAGRDMKKAREEAGRFLGPDPPIWNSLGADIQRAKVASYLEHLRETDNRYIADKLLQDEDVVFELLRTRIKTIRNKKGSSQNKFSSSSVLTLYNVRLCFERIFTHVFTRRRQTWS